MKFNIVMFKENYKNVIKIRNEGIYKPTFNAICYLFENDIKNNNTLTALNEILSNYINFERIDNNENTVIIGRKYAVDLSCMPIKVKEALAMKNQASFNPLKFIKHITNNLNIYENTKMIKIDNNIALNLQKSSAK